MTHMGDEPSTDLRVIEDAGDPPTVALDVRNGKDNIDKCAAVQRQSDGLHHLRDAHAALLARYVSVLDLLHQVEVLPNEGNMTDEGSYLNRRLEGARLRAESGEYNRIRRRPFLRLMLELHIRRKLSELARAYVLHEQVLRASPITAGHIDLLRSSRDDAERLAAALTSWSTVRRVIFSYFWPAAVGLIVASVGAGSVWEAVLAPVKLVRLADVDRGDVTVALVLVIFAIYFLSPIVAVSAHKRGLLLVRSVAPIVRPIDVRVGLADGNNTYQLEDELFRRLGRRKNLESRIDLVAFGVFSSSSSLSVLLVDGSAQIWSGILIFPGIAVVLYILVNKWRHREWR